MPLFDAYLMVDWSAANTPVTGRDSIWVAYGARNGATFLLDWNRNLPTRASAMALVESLMMEAIRSGRRILAGFDFAFGYPQGVAHHLAGAPGWAAMWRLLADEIEDDVANRSNRFALAARLNARLAALDGVRFWGNGTKTDHTGLPRTKPWRAAGAIAERRIVETRVPGAKTVWQLSGAGAVGSQSLLGIAALERLRRRPGLTGAIAVWPFETGFEANLSRPIILCEIYPSLLDVKPHPGEVLDAAQVRTMIECFARLDGEDRLLAHLARPADLSPKSAATVLQEEGWIVGASTLPRLSRARSLRKTKPTAAAGGYVRDPAEIYRRSFATIRAEADLSRFEGGLSDVVIRLIHACGMTDLPRDVSASADFVTAGQAALARGAPVICDVEMVRHGVISRLMPGGNEILCFLGDDRISGLAKAQSTTRSAAQVDLWRARMDGAVIAIGNAPTALFRLLEAIDEGAPRPAAIIGIPVGFVGAVESKEALIADPRGIPYLAIRGRRGGSALASAAVNALAAGLEGHG